MVVQMDEQTKITQEQQKEEAIRRLELCGIGEELIDEFRDEDTVYVSEAPYGVCTEPDYQQKERIYDFEEENNALVYHVITADTEFGELEIYLYVSDVPEDWGGDKEDLQSNKAIAYVNNLTHSSDSESGYIGFETSSADGLIRTW